MTSNSLLTKIKTKFILALIIVGLLCTSLLLFTACKSEDNADKIPSYSYTDTDDGIISNPDFSYGTSGIKLENYPQTSPTGWSRSKDDASTSISAKSGVVDVTEEGWKAMLNSIYSDQNFLTYLEEKIGFSKTDIENELKDKDSSITSDELKAEVVKQYSDKLTAPKLSERAKDNKMYMLNNYISKTEIGASQKITSSSAITIEKGQFVEIKVDVLTQNIKTTDLNNNEITLGLTGAEDEFGASIRLTNSISGKSQAEYAITNINTNGEWKTYTVYAMGDDEFDCKVTLALGLGYSNLYPTEGTVYFDNITVTELETVSNLPEATKLTFGESKAQIVNAGEKDAFFYDMSLTIDNTYYEEISVGIEEFAKTTKFDQAKAEIKDTNVIEVKDASYSVKISNTEKFKLASESYAYVSFKLDSKLDKLASTTITVDVYEGTDKKSAVATVTETGEQSVGIMINNNFDESYTEERSFFIVITVGSTTPSSTDKLSDFANGTVKISEFKIATGKTYQYVKDENGEPTTEEISTYKFYQLFSGITNGSTSLHAGHDSDFTANADENTASTGFGIATTDKVYLNKRPVAPSDYDGIGFDHKYLNSESENSNVNDRTNGNDFTSNVAGIIDTQFIKDYKNTDLSELANIFEENEKIRPLMIYNKDADSYGFVNNLGAQVVAANSFAKVTVRAKVIGESAKAYIYLVDTTTKEVMTFETFTPNSNGISAISGTETVGGTFEIVVGDTKGEWIDVNFYIATGKTEKSFRVELWNGDRTGQTKSTGYVFFESVNVSLSNAFNEPSSFKESFTSSSSPLYAKDSSFTADNPYLCYSRPLTDTEKQFNKEYSDKAISYAHKIVWAKNSDTVYAIFNTLDVEAVNPYDSLEEETTEEEGSGCAAETDPSTFWLSFSSILLTVVLLLAIIALFIKKFRRKNKSSDAKSHYTVKSRVRSVPKAKKETSKKESKQEETEDEEIEKSIDEAEEVEAEEILEETTEEQTETQSDDSESQVSKEQTLDDYVYGDVQNFGEESDDSENKE